MKREEAAKILRGMIDAGNIADQDRKAIETALEALEKPLKVKTFSPPDQDEVKAYCLERGNRVDAERFCDYYASNGWYVGKNKMRDWRAAVRNWERGDGNGSDRRHTQAGNGYGGTYL